MLEVTTKECHGLHRYDCVKLEGDTNSLSSLRRTMTHINSWYNFQDDEIYVSHGAGDGNRCVFEHHRESGAQLKGVIIIDIEMIAAKLYKSPDYSRWNGWQSIVIEFEYGDDWLDKADKNSQCLETYDTTRKTTESEREAKDQITEQANNSVRNGG